MDEADLNVYRSLNKHKVKYLLIGGMAAIIYGSPRLTKDTDIFIEPTLENCQKLVSALQDVHFHTIGLTTAEKVLTNEISIFRDYTRLDVLTQVKGLIFKEAWKKRVVKRIGGVRISMVDVEDLIISKKSAGRDIDLHDVKTLESISRIADHSARKKKKP